MQSPNVMQTTLEGLLVKSCFEGMLCLIRVRSEAEAQKHMKRRQKRKRQKLSKDRSEDNAEADAAGMQPDGALEQQQHDDAVDTITASDELVHLQVWGS